MLQCLGSLTSFAILSTAMAIIDAEASVGTGGLVSLLTGEQLAGFGNLEQRTHAGTSG